MLRRLTIGLFTLACAAAVAACSSSNSATPSVGGVTGVGPNFVTNTVYITDTTQNTVDIYTPSPGPSATPEFQIGGSNTTLNGPSYATFDSARRLYTTNFGAANRTGSILFFQQFATGNVLPFGQVTIAAGSQPHGIALLPSNAGFVVAFTAPGGFFSSFVNLYSTFSGGTTSTVTATLAGSNTQLSDPIGVDVDSNKNLYAANSGNGTVTVYALPSPSPTPSGSPTPTPSPTPSPTATPSGAPTASPTPTPTPSSTNIAPRATIACVPGGGMPSPCMAHPTGLTLDGTGNVYVTDPDSGVTPGVYIFSAAQIACGAPPCALNLTPARFLAGSNTQLVNPTDVKVDSSGTIYVVDSGSGPNKSKLLIFSSTANGNVAPSTAISLPVGSATGMALSP